MFTDPKLLLYDVHVPLEMICPNYHVERCVTTNRAISIPLVSVTGGDQKVQMRVVGAAAVFQSSVSLATSNNIECVPSAIASEMAMSWPGLYPEEEQDLSAMGRFEYPEDTR